MSEIKRTVLIGVGDNDFQNMIEPLTRLVRDFIVYHGIDSKIVTKENIYRITTSAIPAFYWAYQARYNDLPIEWDENNLVYLEDRLKVLVDGEAEKYIETYGKPHAQNDNFYIQLETMEIYGC